MEINIVKLKDYAAHCNVLYVEDDEVIRTQTTRFLERFFPTIDLAENGAEGWQMYQKCRYDIVISDINMPLMNGIEMIEKIRASKPDQIILVTSAYNDAENLIRLINLGVMRFVLKPFDNKQFIIMLYTIVEELQFKKAHELMQRQAAEAQLMIDMVDNGIVLLKSGRVAMANRAFLTMAGFQDFQTLQLELPELGVIFQSAAGDIEAQSNSELISRLLAAPEEERKVHIERDGSLHEYQINFSRIEERNDYVLVFTDITAITEAMNKDEHTGLPNRKLLLDRIESTIMTLPSLPVMLVSVKNFNNVMQWYGKGDAVIVEKEAAHILRDILGSHTFLGYFGQNQFVVIPGKHDPASMAEKLRDSSFAHNAKLKESHLHTDIDFHLSLATNMLQLDGDKGREGLEIDIINGFESMRL